jgi:alpha-beta hydrolase superfamily lysophospholipase
MMALQEDALPCHFGRDNELFGLYHAAAGVARNAVLLCPPLGQDLIRSHRVYRQLAEALADDGTAALRFDYYGSGDSAGRSVDVDWVRCIADIAAAARELRARSGCPGVIAFGARLGGNLAIAASAAAHFVELIVWDPILDGAAHVARLDTLQAALRVDPMRFDTPRSAEDAAGQWLGFAVSPRLRQQLLELSLQPPAIQTRVLDSLPDADVHDWNRLVTAGATVTTLNPPTMWDDLDRLEHAILSHELIRAVTGHLRESAR